MAQTQRIAKSFLTELFEHGALEVYGSDPDPEQVANHLIAEASTVDYQPRRDRLVLTFDLAEKAEDDKPVPYVPAEPEREVYARNDGSSID
jgi:hypothetical protein